MHSAFQNLPVLFSMNALFLILQGQIKYTCLKNKECSLTVLLLQAAIFYQGF